MVMVSRGIRIFESWWVSGGIKAGDEEDTRSL